MSSKQDKIKKMIEMQRKFIDYEHESGVDPVDYWAADEGHPLHGYRQEYMSVAMDVVDEAHKEVGSSRL
jgi:hypothetical protein